MAAAEPVRTNALLIMSDDLRADLASYGSVAKTPSLDRLARRSTQFDHAYCQQALCNPSRSSMLCGRRPDHLRQWNNSQHFRQENPSVVTLPGWFKEHGYDTRCIGKIFHNWHTTVHGDPNSWSTPEFLHYANHGADRPQVAGTLPPNLATAPHCECRDVPDEAYYDGRVAAEAVRVLGEMKDQAFFLAVGFWKPHAPFNAPKRYWDLYDRDKLPVLDPRRSAGVPDVALHDSRELRGAPPNQKTFTPAEAAEMRHGYLAGVSYMDAQVGKVLKALADNGLEGRTLVVFVADHGYHLGEHTLWAKTSNFEFDAHVPLFISRPGQQKPERTEAIVELVDIFPTVDQVCGLSDPAGLDGTSLVPILDDPSRSVIPAAFTQHPRPAYYDRAPSQTPEAMGYSVRTPRVRYTEWRDWRTGRVIARELYDSVHDPAEMHNRYGSAELAAAQHEAESLLVAEFPRRGPS